MTLAEVVTRHECHDVGRALPHPACGFLLCFTGDKVGSYIFPRTLTLLCPGEED